MADPESYGGLAHVDDFLAQENVGTSAHRLRRRPHQQQHSSIPNHNHAYYLMVQEIGRDAAEQVVYASRRRVRHDRRSGLDG